MSHSSGPRLLELASWADRQEQSQKGKVTPNAVLIVTGQCTAAMSGAAAPISLNILQKEDRHQYNAYICSSCHNCMGPPLSSAKNTESTDKHLPQWSACPAGLQQARRTPAHSVQSKGCNNWLREWGIKTNRCVTNSLRAPLCNP